MLFLALLGSGKGSRCAQWAAEAVSLQFLGARERCLELLLRSHLLSLWFRRLHFVYGAVRGLRLRRGDRLLVAVVGRAFFTQLDLGFSSSDLRKLVLFALHVAPQDLGELVLNQRIVRRVLELQRSNVLEDRSELGVVPIVFPEKVLRVCQGTFLELLDLVLIRLLSGPSLTIESLSSERQGRHSPTVSSSM